MLTIFAMLTMLIDHIGILLMPPLSGAIDETFMCRAIGRLAMPIFAYKIANGFIHTRNFKKYFGRMTMLTIVSQVPFALMMSQVITGVADIDLLFDLNRYPHIFSSLNIGWTFMCALLVLYIINIPSNLIAVYIFKFIALFIVMCFAPVGDYGVYGVATVVVFYMAIKRGLSFPMTVFLFIAITFGFNSRSETFYLLLQMISVLSVFLVALIPDTRSKYDKFIFYAFYPIHMIILLYLV
ncbi:MAG: hypothetical protein ATN35_07485 [Epulopiscium sp. Nele67-Bin004]|nr:MAG: hypothetical protein ATN35_07485 [Epulopiscium sp. Nele67-Bin004]